MRLLSLCSNGSFALTKFTSRIPPYAILSHTWQATNEELTFQDIRDSTRRSELDKKKMSYKKLQFCGDQAKKDQLKYFWVDSCCIDKSSSAELSESINSMFRWYRNAAKCYVYLSDVSTQKATPTMTSQIVGHARLRHSRWFSRGWTLQELLAPQALEFFSKEGESLGDRKALELHISEITRIPVGALQGTPLSHFGVNERLSWASSRQTTVEEDHAYSLLGIFGTYMPLIYGEGAMNAFRRLREEIDKSATVSNHAKSASPFYFESGLALFAKGPSRPIPPPFYSLPFGSESNPITTYLASRYQPPSVSKHLLRGITNGEDAVFVSDKFICVNDGVGAWAQEEKGHAALFSRLMAHFWAKQVEDNSYSSGGDAEPDPMICLQRAYEHTNAATAQSGWVGTTTASGALLSWDRKTVIPQPVLYITQLGDSQIMVLCPRDRAITYKTREQWHWFDCPRQLGTNSPDMPESNAVVDLVRVQEDDVVLAMSDGVVDNLWDHEVLQIVLDSMDRWKKGEAVSDSLPAANSELREQSYPDEMMYVAAELVKAAKAVAQDPFAESPYMEKACDEGLSIEGGKMDDISVVAAIIKRRRI